MPEKEKPNSLNASQPVQVSATPIVIRDKDGGPGCLTQVVWFVFIGWWLSQLAVLAGYALVITVILMPFGFALLNRVPKLATMRSFDEEINAQYKDGVLVVERSQKEQRHWFTRLVYFLVIGWWFGLLVLELAWLFTSTLVFAPIGLSLFRFAPKALTLHR